MTRSPEVCLRPVRPADHARFVDWVQDPEVRRHYLGEYAADQGPDDLLEWVPGRGPGEPPIRRAPIGTARPAGHLVRAIETTDGMLLGGSNYVT